MYFIYIICMYNLVHFFVAKGALSLHVVSKYASLLTHVHLTLPYFIYMYTILHISPMSSVSRGESNCSKMACRGFLSHKKL